jgi:hypothetical protein
MLKAWRDDDLPDGSVLFKRGGKQPKVPLIFIDTVDERYNSFGRRIGD